MARAARFTEKLSASLGGPDWLRARRAAAFAGWDTSGLPSESEEIWRYSRIDELDVERFAPQAATDPPSERAAPPFDSKGLPHTSALVWTDSRGVVSTEVAPDLVSKGLVVTSARSVYQEDGVAARSAAEWAAERFGTIAHDDDALVGLAGAFVEDVVVVWVPDGLVVDDPIVLVHWHQPSDGSQGAAVFPRTLVRAGESSVCKVVEIHASNSEGSGRGGPVAGRRPMGCLSLPVTEIEVASDAACDYVSVQDLSSADWQIAEQSSTVGRDARFTSFTAFFGGDYARARVDSHTGGSGSTTRLLAAYFASGGQMHDFRTMQDHGAPHSRSDLFFKGAVSGQARSVYSGLIRIRRGAVRSDAFQENRNLVLSPGAHAESVPNLDIQENDVRCSHASAVGPVDAEQRYYLESRGIPTADADQLIVEGFFEDILRRSPDIPAVKAMVRDQVASKLTASVDEGELEP